MEEARFTHGIENCGKVRCWDLGVGGGTGRTTPYIYPLWIQGGGHRVELKGVKNNQ